MNTQGAGPIIHPTQTRLFALGGFVLSVAVIVAIALALYTSFKKRDWL